RSAAGPRTGSRRRLPDACAGSARRPRAAVRLVASPLARREASPSSLLPTSAGSRRITGWNYGSDDWDDVSCTPIEAPAPGKKIEVSGTPQNKFWHDATLRRNRREELCR